MWDFISRVRKRKQKNGEGDTPKLAPLSPGAVVFPEPAVVATHSLATGASLTAAVPEQTGSRLPIPGGVPVLGGSSNRGAVLVTPDELINQIQLMSPSGSSRLATSGGNRNRQRFLTPPDGSSNRAPLSASGSEEPYETLGWVGNPLYARLNFRVSPGDSSSPSYASVVSSDYDQTDDTATSPAAAPGYLPMRQARSAAAEKDPYVFQQSPSSSKEDTYFMPSTPKRPIAVRAGSEENPYLGPAAPETEPTSQPGSFGRRSPQRLSPSTKSVTPHK